MWRGLQWRVVAVLVTQTEVGRERQGETGRAGMVGMVAGKG